MEVSYMNDKQIDYKSYDAELPERLAEIFELKQPDSL